MLPEISVEISVKNFGNTFKIEIYFLKKQWKYAASTGRYDREGGASGQKFLSDVIRISLKQNPMADRKDVRALPSHPKIDLDKSITDFDEISAKKPEKSKFLPNFKNS